MRRARIYKPTKTATQSGKAATKKWCLEFIPNDSRYIEPLMGWTGSKDMYLTEVKLLFDTQEDAINYANREGIKYEILKHEDAPIIIKSYLENFKHKKHA